MPELILETHINADPDACFALMRDGRIHGDARVERYPESEDGTPVLGETIKFETRFMGISQVLVVRCIELIPGRRVVDAMTRGRIGLFAHVHDLLGEDGATVLRDTVIWESRSGIFESTVDELVIKRRLTDLVSGRNSRLKALAEGTHD